MGGGWGLWCLLLFLFGNICFCFLLFVGGPSAGPWVGGPSAGQGEGRKGRAEGGRGGKEARGNEGCKGRIVQGALLQD